MIWRRFSRRVTAYLDTRQATALTPASPMARRLASENGVALADIAGSGPEGAVLVADVRQQVERMKAAPTPAPSVPVTAQGETLPVSRMWQIMAQRLTESWTTVPHFYLERTVNASALKDWRQRAQANAEVKITFTDLLVKIVAMALRRHEHVNGQWTDGTIHLNPAVNVGLAVAVDEGLLVPVIHNADRLGLSDIAVKRADVVSRAQENKLRPDDMSGGTFTVSNLGMFGIESFNAIVNPPQAAILALGSIQDVVRPLDGQPTVQPVMTMTLSCDHRVVDGARGAAFLQTLAQYIENPLSLLN